MYDNILFIINHLNKFIGALVTAPLKKIALLVDAQNCTQLVQVSKPRIRDIAQLIGDASSKSIP